MIWSISGRSPSRHPEMPEKMPCFPILASSVDRPRHVCARGSGSEHTRRPQASKPRLKYMYLGFSRVSIGGNLHPLRLPSSACISGGGQPSGPIGTSTGTLHSCPGELEGVASAADRHITPSVLPTCTHPGIVCIVCVSPDPKHTSHAHHLGRPQRQPGVPFHAVATLDLSSSHGLRTAHHYAVPPHRRVTAGRPCAAGFNRDGPCTQCTAIDPPAQHVFRLQADALCINAMISSIRQLARMHP